MRAGRKLLSQESGYDQSIPHGNHKGLMRSDHSVGAVWEHGSSRTALEQMQYIESKRRASEYSISKPWDQEPTDGVMQSERHLEGLNYQLIAPWVEAAVDEEAELSRKLHAISNYQYQPLWQPETVTLQRKQQIDNYRLKTPYQTKENDPKEFSKPSKRSIPGYSAKTLAPWQHGATPPDLAPMKVQFEAPRTGFWPVPKVTEEAAESSGDPILDNLRMQLKRHGANGVLGLARKFRIIDDNNSGSLDLTEFSKAMRECEVADLSKRAVEHLFRYFDSDDSGSVSYDEFLVGVRGQLTARRRAIVQVAFNVLDKDRSGVVDLDDIRDVYNVTCHPDFISGKKSSDMLLKEFLSNFEGPRGKRNGHLTEKDFESYYSNISASIDDDNYFELMIRNAWHISGGEGACANSSNRRVLVTHADGRQTVEEVQNDLGVSKNDIAGIQRRLESQGISASDIATYGYSDNAHRQREREGASSSSSSSSSYRPQSMSLLQQRQQQQQQRQEAHRNRYSPRGHPHSHRTSQSPSLSGRCTAETGHPPTQIETGTPRMRPKSLSEHLNVY